jgi:AraC-like DNA-binding protein
MSSAAAKKSLIGTSELHFASGHRETLHVHADYAQLKWPSSGVSSVRTPDGIFVTAPAQAVWIPPGLLHGGMYGVDVLEKNVFVHEDHCRALPPRCCLVSVSARLSDAITRAVSTRAGYGVRSREDDEAVLRLLEAEVHDSGRHPLALGLPEGSPLQVMLDEILRSPGDQRTLAAWSRRLKLAERSLRRTFARETGLPFSEWSKRARVLQALQRLSAGEDVTSIAAALGYESASAFVYMFRKTLGITPGRYYAIAR